MVNLRAVFFYDGLLENIFSVIMSTWEGGYMHKHEQGQSCCSCGCGHDHAHTHEENIYIFASRLFLALVVVLGDLFDLLPHDYELILFVVAYFFAGYNVVWQALQNILHGHFFDENFLMVVASMGAFGLGDMEEAVSVMIFYGIGELLQSMAVQRSRADIAALMDIRPDFANIKIDGGIRCVHPNEVKIGDIILVKPGEKVPLDGVVLSGESYADTRALTGESLPKHLSAGSEVLSGYINTGGSLEIRTTKVFGESTASKILRLIENAHEKKAQSEHFITKFARYYTPFVVFTALGVAIIPPLLGYGSFDTWIYRALTFLIVSCPCALVVSIPISFFGGIGAAAHKGILVKGGNYLEALNNVDTIVFDKTGTLTQGVFEVVEINPVEGTTDKQLLEYAAIAEVHSTHPIGRAILLAHGANPKINVQVQEESGMGVIAQTAEHKIYAGSRNFMSKLGIEDLPYFAHSVVFVAVDGNYIGYILIADKIKDNARSVLAGLKAMGVRCIVMLTGDSEEVAKEFVNKLGLDGYSAGLLPQDKVVELEKLMAGEKKGGKVVFVGDGINDAPVITRADVGVAMGGIGSDAAIAAANIVIMNDDIGKLATAIRVANKTRQIVWQNIVFALGVKVAVMVLAFFGITSMWFAIFADVGVALIAVLNALRAMRI